MAKKNEIKLALSNPKAEKIINAAYETDVLGCVPERIGDWMPGNYKKLQGKADAIAKLPRNKVMPTAEVYLAFILDEVEVQLDNNHAGDSGDPQFAEACKKNAADLKKVAKQLRALGIKPAHLPWDGGEEKKNDAGLSKTDKERICKALIVYAKELKADKTPDLLEYNRIEYNEATELYDRLGGE